MHFDVACDSSKESLFFSFDQYSIGALFEASVVVVVLWELSKGFVRVALILPAPR